MKKLGATICCIVALQFAQSKEIIAAFGKTANIAFNGWSVEPYAAFSDVIFNEGGIELHSINGGDYTINFQHKMVELQDYSNIQIQLNFLSTQNAKLNFVDAALSSDGKAWSYLAVDQKLLSADIENANSDFKHLKISVNLSLKSNAIFQFTDLELSGNKNKTELQEQLPEVKQEQPFFVFCFNRSITVETKLESPYYETSESTRIEPELNDGIYIVSIIQNQQLIMNKKVIF